MSAADENDTGAGPADETEVPNAEQEQYALQAYQLKQEAMYRACFQTEAGQWVLEDLKQTFNYGGAGIVIDRFPIARVDQDMIAAVFSNQLVKKPIEHIEVILHAAQTRANHPPKTEQTEAEL